MTELRRYRLSDSVPWTNAEWTGFLISWLGSATVMTAVAYWAFSSDMPVNVVLIWLVVAVALFVLNAPICAIKRQHWMFQWLACFAMFLIVPKDAIQENAIITFLTYTVGPSIWFVVLRVNWWFYWDNPSRRTLTEKTFFSILYTGIPVLGLGIALWRVLGFGVEMPTTVFVETPKGPLETLPENPALVEHARRMAAIRAPERHRTMSASKDELSKTL